MHKSTFPLIVLCAIYRYVKGIHLASPSVHEPHLTTRWLLLLVARANNFRLFLGHRGNFRVPPTADVVPRTADTEPPTVDIVPPHAPLMSHKLASPDATDLPITLITPLRFINPSRVCMITRLA